MPLYVSLKEKPFAIYNPEGNYNVEAKNDFNYVDFQISLIVKDSTTGTDYTPGTLNIDNIQISNDPDFITTKTIKYTNIAFIPDKINEVTINLGDFGESKDKSSAAGVDTTGETIFKFKNWPISSSGGQTKIYFKLSLNALNPISHYYDPGSYPSNGYAYVIILWSTMKPVTPGTPILNTIGSSYYKHPIYSKLSWNFASSNEDATGAKNEEFIQNKTCPNPFEELENNTGISRYMADMINLNHFTPTLNGLSASGYILPLKGNMWSSLLTIKQFDCNDGTDGTENANWIKTQQNITRTSGKSFKNSSQTISTDEASPDISVQAHFIPVIPTSASGDLNVEIFIEDNGGINQYATKIIINESIIKKIAKSQSTSETETILDIPFELFENKINDIALGGSLELYCEKRDHLNLSIIAVYYTPTNSNESFLIDLSVVPLINTTNVVCGIRFFTSLNNESPAHQIQCDQMCIGTGIFALNADVGDCKDDEKSICGFPIIKTENWTESIGDNKDWQMLSSTIKPNNFENNLTIKAPTGEGLNKQIKIYYIAYNSSNEVITSASGDIALPSDNDWTRIFYTFETGSTVPHHIRINLCKTDPENSFDFIIGNLQLQQGTIPGPGANKLNTNQNNPDSRVGYFYTHNNWEIYQERTLIYNGTPSYLCVIPTDANARLELTNTTGITSNTDYVFSMYVKIIGTTTKPVSVYELQANKPSFSNRLDFTWSMAQKSGDFYVAFSHYPGEENSEMIRRCLASSVTTNLPENKPTIALMFSVKTDEFGNKYTLINVLQKNMDGTVTHRLLNKIDYTTSLTKFNLYIDSDADYGTSLILKKIESDEHITYGDMRLENKIGFSEEGLGLFTTIGVISTRTETPKQIYDDLASVCSELQGECLLAGCELIVLPSNHSLEGSNPLNIRHFYKGSIDSVNNKSLLGQILLSGNTNEKDFPFINNTNLYKIYAQKIELSDFYNTFLDGDKPGFSLIEFKMQSNSPNSELKTPKINFYGDTDGLPNESLLDDWINCIDPNTGLYNKTGNIIPYNNLIQFDVTSASGFLNSHDTFWLYIAVPPTCSLGASWVKILENSIIEIEDLKEQLILNTTDYGVQFGKQSICSLEYLGNEYVLAGTSSASGIIIASGTILRSADGGETWIDLDISDLGYDSILSITNIGSGVILAGAASASGTILRSTDYGITWIETFNPIEMLKKPYSIAKVSNDIIFAAGEFNGPIAKIAKSINGGVTWTINKELTGEEACLSLIYLKDGILLAGTSPNGKIYRTDDMGTNWIEIDLQSTDNLGPSFSETHINSLIYLGLEKILAGTSPNGKILQSLDLGITWEEVTTGITQTTISTFTYAGDGKIYAGSWDNGYLLYSEDYGITWKSSGQLCDQNRIYALKYLENNIVIVGTGDSNTGEPGHGKILKIAGLTKTITITNNLWYKCFLDFIEQTSQDFQSFQSYSAIQTRVMSQSQNMTASLLNINTSNPSSLGNEFIINLGTVEFSTFQVFHDTIGQKITILYDVNSTCAHRVIYETVNGYIHYTNWSGIPGSWFKPIIFNNYSDQNFNKQIAATRKIWVELMSLSGQITRSQPISVLLQTIARTDFNPPNGECAFIDDARSPKYITNNRNSNIKIDNAFDQSTEIKDFRIRDIINNNFPDWSLSPWINYNDFAHYILSNMDGLHRAEIQLRDYGNNIIIQNLTQDLIFQSSEKNIIFTAGAIFDDSLYLCGIKNENYANLTLERDENSNQGFNTKSFFAKSSNSIIFLKKNDRITDLTIDSILYTYKYHTDSIPESQYFYIDTTNGTLVVVDPTDTPVLPSDTPIVASFTMNRETAILYTWDKISITKITDFGYYNEQCILSIVPYDNKLYFGGISGNIYTYDGIMINNCNSIKDDFNRGLPISVLIVHQFGHETTPYLYAATSNVPELWRYSTESNDWIHIANEGYLAESTGSITSATSAYNILFLGTNSGKIIQYTRSIGTGSIDTEEVSENVLSNTNTTISSICASGNQIFAGIKEKSEIWTSNIQFTESEEAPQFVNILFDDYAENDPSRWEYYHDGLTTLSSVINKQSENIKHYIINDPEGINEFKYIKAIESEENKITILKTSSDILWIDRPYNFASQVYSLELEMMNLKNPAGEGKQGIRIADGAHIFEVAFSINKIYLRSGNNFIEKEINNSSYPTIFSEQQVRMMEDSLSGVGYGIPIQTFISSYNEGNIKNPMIYPRKAIKSLWNFYDDNKEGYGPFWHNNSDESNNPYWLTGDISNQFKPNNSTASTQHWAADNFVANIQATGSNPKILEIVPTEKGNPRIVWNNPTNIPIEINTISKILIRVKYEGFSNTSDAKIKVSMSNSEHNNWDDIVWLKSSILKTTSFITYEFNPAFCGDVNAIAIEFEGLPEVDREHIFIDYIAIVNDIETASSLDFENNLIPIRIDVSGTDVTIWVGKTEYPIIKETNFLSAVTNQVEIAIGKLNIFKSEIDLNIENKTETEKSSVWAYGKIKLFNKYYIPSPITKIIYPFHKQWEFLSSNGISRIVNYKNTCWAFTNAIEEVGDFSDSHDSCAKSHFYDPNKQIWQEYKSITDLTKVLIAVPYKSELVLCGQNYFSAQDGENSLLLLYNTNSIRSKRIADYYYDKREKDVNIYTLGIPWTTPIYIPNDDDIDSQISGNTFNIFSYDTEQQFNWYNETFLTPIRAFLNENNIKVPKYVVISKDMPSITMWAEPGGVAVTLDEWLQYDLSTQKTARRTRHTNNYGYNYSWSIHTYLEMTHFSERLQEFADDKYRITRVCRLEGATERTVYGLIDKSLEADNYTEEEVNDLVFLYNNQAAKFMNPCEINQAIDMLRENGVGETKNINSKTIRSTEDKDGNNIGNHIIQYWKPEEFALTTFLTGNNVISHVDQSVYNPYIAHFSNISHIGTVTNCDSNGDLIDELEFPGDIPIITEWGPNGGGWILVLPDDYTPYPSPYTMTPFYYEAGYEVRFKFSETETMIDKMFTFGPTEYIIENFEELCNDPTNVKCRIRWARPEGRPFTGTIYEGHPYKIYGSQVTVDYNRYRSIEYAPGGFAYGMWSNYGGTNGMTDLSEHAKYSHFTLWTKMEKENGPTVSVGPTTEPYAGGMWNQHYLMAFYMMGYDFATAHTLSRTSNSNTRVAIGDPLCSPFKRYPILKKTNPDMITIFKGVKNENYEI